MKNLKPYLKTYFAAVLILLFTIGLINSLVDPLWYFKGNQITGINPPWNERIAKTNLFLNHPNYECLILGTSRSTLFDTNLLAQDRCFNYSFSGGKIEEYINYLTYLRDKGIQPQKIYVELEFTSFNRREKPRTFEPVSDTLPVYRAYLFSNNVLQLSIRTLIQAYEFARLYDQDFRGIVSEDVPTYEPEFSNDWEQEECDPQRLELFQTLKNVFPEAQVIGFVAPISGWYVFNDSYTSGALECQLAGIHQVASFFDDMYDFAVPSVVTTRTDNTYDGNHYYPKVYRKVAERLEGSSSEFGVHVNTLSLRDYQTLYLERLNWFLAREKQPPARFKGLS